MLTLDGADVNHHVNNLHITCVSAELQRCPIRHNGAKKKLQLKHKNSLFTLQTDLTRTGIISNCYNEMFEA